MAAKLKMNFLGCESVCETIGFSHCVFLLDGMMWKWCFAISPLHIVSHLTEGIWRKEIQITVLSRLAKQHSYLLPDICYYQYSCLLIPDPLVLARESLSSQSTYCKGPSNCFPGSYCGLGVTVSRGSVWDGGTLFCSLLSFLFFQACIRQGTLANP